jgi:RNA polymerase sigma-70 factor (ECF subfamily)
MMGRSLRQLPAKVKGTQVAEEPRSFEEFFASEHRRLFGALCLVTGDRSEAEEIMQDAFLRLWERWDRVADVDDPSGYLFRTAMNLFRNRYRRAGLAVKKAINAIPTEDALATVEDRDVVVRALRALTPDQRAAVVLTNYVGLTSDEAGRVLGMRPSTVRTLATRARAAVRDKAGDPR